MPIQSKFKYVEGFCSYCKNPCTVIEFDDGIGVTEYWGYRLNHSLKFAASDCCEEPAHDSNGKEITLDDLEYGVE